MSSSDDAVDRVPPATSKPFGSVSYFSKGKQCATDGKFFLLEKLIFGFCLSLLLSPL